MVVIFEQKTAYEMRISDWSSDVCSSDLLRKLLHAAAESSAALDFSGDQRRRRQRVQIVKSGEHRVIVAAQAARDRFEDTAAGDRQRRRRETQHDVLSGRQRDRLRAVQLRIAARKRVE